MAGVPTIDEDEENIPDLDYFIDGQNGVNQKHNELMLKNKLRQLRAEEQRRTEYEMQLRNKLIRLEGDLAAKREQVEGLKTNLMYKQRKRQDNVESEKKELLEKARVEQERILDHLSKVLYQRPRKVEGDALVTVLVSFTKPGTFIRYNLAFRIDEDTEVQQLREAVTMYWNVDEKDYILKTLANSKCQRDLKVQDCFKHGDIAQLMLEQKTNENAEGPSAEELKAIQPKGKSGKKGGANRTLGYDSSKAENIARHNNTQEPMRRMGGIYFLLKLREKKPSEHVSKIKCRDFCLYTMLILLTVVVYTLRRAEGRNFFYALGVENELLREVPYAGQPPSTAYTANIPSFTKLKTYDDLWSWLDTSLPHLVWGNSTGSLGKKNYLVGYVRIRVQNVKPDSVCSSHNKEAVANIPGARCLGDSSRPKVTQGEQQTEDFTDLRTYWDYVTSVNETDENFRGPTEPWKYRTPEYNEKNHKMSVLTGIIDSYSAGGYSVDYRMRLLDASSEIYRYYDDMAEFRSVGWFCDRTRLVVVSMTIYNNAYDMWLAVDLLQEVLPGGALVGSAQVRPFKPTEFETLPELFMLYTDFIRCIIAIYILIVIGPAECRHKMKNNKAGTWYFQYNGIMDYGMVTCVFVVAIWRVVQFDTHVNIYMDNTDDAPNTVGFVSSSALASNHQTIFILEGLGFMFMMMRMVNLFRIFDHVFLLWRTIGEAALRLFYFLGMFAPVVFFLGLLLQIIFGYNFEEYLDMNHTMLTVLQICQGRLDIITRMLEVELAWGMFFVFVAFLAVRFLMLNVLVTNVIDAYYITRITTTQAVEQWSTEKWLQWATPRICHLFTSALTSNQPR